MARTVSIGTLSSQIDAAVRKYIESGDPKDAANISRLSREKERRMMPVSIARRKSQPNGEA